LLIFLSVGLAQGNHQGEARKNMLLATTLRENPAFEVTVVSVSTLGFLMRTTGHGCGEIQISLGK